MSQAVMLTQAHHPILGPMPALQLLCIEGVDAAKMMQNYVTTDLLEAPEGALLLGLCCNRQGRVLADVDLIKMNHQLYLVVLAGVAPLLEKHLAPYLAFSQSKMSRCTDWTLTCLPADQLPAGLGPVAPGQAICTDQALLMRYTTSPAWVLHWQHPDRQSTKGGGASDTTTATTAEARHQWWSAEIAGKRARITAELAEQFLPQALGYEALGGIDYAKGCYLGQEIIARAHYRGALKQELKKLTTGAELPAKTAFYPGALLMDGDHQKIGVLINAAASQETAGVTLLAVMQTQPAGHEIFLKDSKLVTTDRQQEIDDGN